MLCEMQKWWDAIRLESFHKTISFPLPIFLSQTVTHTHTLSLSLSLSYNTFVAVVIVPYKITACENQSQTTGILTLKLHHFKGCAVYLRKTNRKTPKSKPDTHAVSHNTG
jgi:hypothetical protein